MMDSMKNMFDLVRLHNRTGEEGCSRPVGRPKRDWVFVCALCGMLLMLGAAFDGWMYLSVTQSARQMQAPPYSAGPTAADLQDLLSQYSALGSEHAALLAKEPAVVDPSKAR